MIKSRKFLGKCILTSSYFQAFCSLKDRYICMQKVPINSSTKDTHLFLRYFFFKETFYSKTIIIIIIILMRYY